MTVVAAFPLHGVPILLGDLLITANASVGSPSFLPTSPHLSGNLPEKVGARVAGACKKVHLIGPTLAVAWSGWQLAASQILGRLNEAFSKTPATKETLAGVLAKLVDYEDERFSLHLVGWVVDSAPTCFRWNSMWPQEIFVADSHFDGSGEDVFSNLLREKLHASAFGPGIGTPAEAAVFAVLAKASKLMEKEVSTGETLSHRFGYGYEVAYFEAGMFRYVDEVTYLMWEVVANRGTGTYGCRLGPTIMKYRNFGEFSIVQTTQLMRDQAEVTYVDLITPVHKTLLDIDPHALGRQPLRSAYYCNFLDYSIEGSGNVRGTFVTHVSDQTFMGHEIRDGKDFLWLNMANINDAIGISAGQMRSGPVSE